MDYKDYYRSLGIDRNADEKAVRQAYRRLARKYHPDVSTEADAEERFKEIQEAYEVLKDADKRRAYDRFGQHWKAAMEQGATGAAYRQTSSQEDVGGFEDLLGSIFGDSARAPGGAWRGRDEYANLTISLADAYHGAVRSLSLDSWARGDHGQPERKRRTIRVKIPAGVSDGQRIRLAGQGQPGGGKQRNGDLFLNISIRPQPGYRLQGRDVFLDVPVAPWEAALGGRITLPTLAGKVMLTIPAGSQAGQELRLRGKGLPGHPHGDLYVILKIVIPTPTSEADRELYLAMARTMAFDPRTGMGAS